MLSFPTSILPPQTISLVGVLDLELNMSDEMHQLSPRSPSWNCHSCCDGTLWIWMVLTVAAAYFGAACIIWDAVLVLNRLPSVEC
jgi:hypothetical protein